MKEMIAADLSKKETVLNNNNFGKFISTNCSLSLFKRAREDWNKLQKTDDKKRELFNDILGTKKKDKKREAPVETTAENEITPFSPPPKKKKDKKREAPVETTAEKEIVSSSSPPPKKKKKQAKSYLDDL